MAPPAAQPSFLATRRGKLTLALLASIAFLDFVDASIVNVALPSIRRALHFSEQELQWVPSGYLLTYGGFMLLGGRAADLLGRRRVLVTGISVIGISSLIGGLAESSAVLIGARLAQGLGAALTLPAALSILTTSFKEGSDRTKALAAWGAVGGLASAAGVLLGGLLVGGPGWRWVMFVNPVAVVLVLGAVFRLLDGERKRPSLENFDFLGAILATGGMLLLVYALVKAPDIGWGATRTVGELAGALALLAAFVRNELRHRNPLAPMSIFRINGLGFSDATQLIAFAGFLAMFFFLTLYMQNVLGYSAIQTGAAYVPLTFGVIIAAGITSQLIPRIGTRPVIVAGRADRRRRAVLALANSRARFLCLGPAPGNAGPIVRTRSDVRRRHDRGERRRSGGEGRARGGVAQRLAAARGRARTRDLLGDSHEPYSRPVGRARVATARAHRGLLSGAGSRQRLPTRRRDHRSARDQHPRGATRATRRARRAHPGRDAPAGAFMTKAPSGP